MCSCRLEFAQEHGLSFIETSAKTGQNTDRAFDLTIQGIGQKTILFDFVDHK
jgi:hypothetical protein